MSQISSLNKVCMHIRRFSDLVSQEFVCITHWPGLSFETQGSIILVKSESHPPCLCGAHTIPLPCDGVKWWSSCFIVAHSISVTSPQRTDPICVLCKASQSNLHFLPHGDVQQRTPIVHVLSSSWLIILIIHACYWKWCPLAWISSK